MRNILLRGLAAILLACTGSTQADLLVGEYRGTGPSDRGPILRFGPQQQGDVAPLSSLTTDLPGLALVTPLSMTYEPADQLLYVADYYGQAIRVYPAAASGNTAPIRTITSVYMGQPRKPAIDRANNEIILPISNCCIGTFARDASGDAGFPLRQIWWGGNGGASRLNNPVMVELLPSGEIVVGDYASSGSVNNGVLLFFARTASGDAAPLRTLEGPATQIGDFVASFAYIPGHDELMVATARGSTWRIVSFAASASGNAAPLRVIEGAATTLNNVSSLAYDAATDLIHVSADVYNAPTPRVISFARTASGNVAPLQHLGGANTGIQSPYGLAVVPGDTLFRDGFQSP